MRKTGSSRRMPNCSSHRQPYSIKRCESYQVAEKPIQPTIPARNCDSTWDACPSSRGGEFATPMWSTIAANSMFVFNLRPAAQVQSNFGRETSSPGGSRTPDQHIMKQAFFEFAAHFLNSCSETDRVRISSLTTTRKLHNLAIGIICQGCCNRVHDEKTMALFFGCAPQFQI
jgi:hypothetical protein